LSGFLPLTLLNHNPPHSSFECSSEITAMRDFLRMLSFVRPYKGKFAIFFVCALIFSAVNVVPLLLIERFLGAFFTDEPQTENIQSLAIVFFFSFLVIGYFEWRRTYIAAWIASRCVLDVNNRLMSHLLSLDLSFFDRNRTGDLVSRISGDSGALQDVVTLLSRIIREPLTLIAMLSAALYLEWRLTLLALGGIPIAVLFLRPLLKRIRRSSKRAREKTADRTDALTQYLGGVKVVKAYGLEKEQQVAYEAMNERLFRYGLKLANSGAISRPALYSLVGLGIGVTIVVGGGMVASKELAPQTFFATIAALMALQRPMRNLLGAINKAVAALPGAERVYEILDTLPQITDVEDAVEVHGFRDSIQFRNVGFSYGREVVLHGIDLEIKAGQTVAFVGPTGAGKTTLVNLVGRLYEPTSGEVLFDGVDQRKIKQSSLLAQLALVTQEPYLFNTSIRANIRHGRSGASDEEIEQAARAANIHDEVASFPDGYETQAGEWGSQLSGGQRQRVAIARAIVRRAPLLVLDEATSNLDSTTERLVQNAIDDLVAGCTSLVIAHRLSTVRNADMIVVLQAGRIVDRGTHDELVESCDLYREMWSHQSGEATTEEENKSD
jgi:subfamily B ATP-binding cassette protein MsbA